MDYAKEELTLVEDTEEEMVEFDPKIIKAGLKDLGWDNIDPNRFIEYLQSQGITEINDIHQGIIASYVDEQRTLTTAATMKERTDEVATEDGAFGEPKPVAISVEQPRADEGRRYEIPHSCETLEIKNDEKMLKELLQRITKYSNDFAKLGDGFALKADLIKVEVYMLKQRWNDASNALKKIKENMGNIDQRDLFHSHRMLARAAMEGGLFDYSQEILEGLKGLQHGLGDNDIEMVRTNIEYGILWEKRGYYPGALGYLVIASNYLDDKNIPDSIQCFTTLAKVQMKLGKYKEAEYFQVRVVEILKRTEGQKKSLRIAEHNLGQILRKSGQLQKAMALLQEVVDCFEKEMGKDHSETFTAKVHLGDIYFDMGMLNTAAALYEEAMQSLEKLFKDTPDNPEILSMKEKLSRVMLGIARERGTIGCLWIDE